MESHVTVVIPTYNGAAFIREALESVYRQTLAPVEVIVVDDASTDATPEIVRASSRHSPIPVRLVQLPDNSGGPAHPMNVGVGAAQAAYVALLDQDDHMDRNKVRSHAHLFAQEPGLGLVFGRARRMTADGVVGPDRSSCYSCFKPGVVTPVGDGDFRIEPSDAYRLLLTEGYNYGGAGGTTISRNAWAAVGGFDETFRIAWDYNFAVRVTRSGFSVGYRPETAYYRRWHGANLEGEEGGRRLREECLRLFRQEATRPHSVVGQKRLARAAYCDYLIESAYYYRQGRTYRHALVCLGRAAFVSGRLPRLAAETAKTVLHAAGLLDFFRSTRRGWAPGPVGAAVRTD
jgi:glycosyltransferase involved in cell wall biosynthesis